MSDDKSLVERLRAAAYWWNGSWGGREGETSTPLEAASAIERLTRELAEARAALQSERDKAAKKEAERQRFREIVAEGIREAREKKAAHD